MHASKQAETKSSRKAKHACGMTLDFGSRSVAAAFTVALGTSMTRRQAPASPLPPGAVWGQGVETGCSLLGGPGWG